MRTGTSSKVFSKEPVFPEQIPALLTARPCAKYALVFGNEANGLSAEELRQCTRSGCSMPAVGLRLLSLGP